MSAVRSFPTLDAMVAALAAQVAALAHQAIEARGRFVLGLSGGRTPAHLYRHLRASALAWEKITLLMVDERCVPPEHHDSNYGLAERELLCHLAARPEVLRMRGELGPEAGAADYAAQFMALALPVDCLLLGVGDDGHVASLFPDDAGWQNAGEAVGYTTTEKAGHARISLTMDALNHARSRLFMASGATKQPALAAWQRQDAALPVGRVCLPATTWYVTPDVLGEPYAA